MMRLPDGHPAPSLSLGLAVLTLQKKQNVCPDPGNAGPISAFSACSFEAALSGLARVRRVASDVSSHAMQVGGFALSMGEAARLALLWRGDRQARRDATPHNNRLSRVFEALTALGVRAEPAVYADDLMLEVRDQLLKLDGVFVW